MLKELGFYVYCEHPYPFVIEFATVLELEPEVVQCAWNIVNDRLV